MKKKLPEQLNTFVPVETEQEEFSLESIMREFGAPAQTDDTRVFAPIEDERSALREAATAPLPSLDAFHWAQQPKAQPDEDGVLLYEPKVSKRTTEPPMRETPVKEPRSPLPETPAEELPPRKAQTEKPHPSPISQVSAEEPPQKPKKAKRTRKPKEPKNIRPVPEAKTPESVETPQSLCKKAQRHLPFAQLRCSLLGIVALVMLLPVFLSALPPFLSDKTVVLAAAVLALVLATDVLYRGIKDILRLRISLYTLALVVSALAIYDALTSADSGYAALLPLLLYYLCRALLLERSGAVHTLKTVGSFSASVGIFAVPKLLKDSDGLRRDRGDTEDYLVHLAAPDLPQTVFCVYSVILLALSAATAYFLAVYSEQYAFSRVWLLLLLGGLPFAGTLCYVRPFAALSKRLTKCGGALCGWFSARIFAKRHTVILRDEDLFPKGYVASNGMKLYGSLGAGRVIAYALAALDAAENPLSEIFEDLLRAQYGRHYTADAFRIYDTGGIGAEIGADVVLVGSLPFMRSMGVHMPNGTRVRQAVYVSVNGELSGIFAIKYKPTSAARSGLRDILSKHSIRVILGTRDFLLTPELLAAKFELSTETLICPAYSERLRLSEADPERSAEQGALISGDSFGAFASTVAAGKSLRSAALTTLCLCLFAGVLGFALCTLLIFWASPASPLHIAAFQLLWGILTAFVSWIAVHF